MGETRSDAGGRAAADVARAVFDAAPFVTDAGIRFVAAGPGWCEAELDLAPRHRQHHGLVHAGVQATLADHTSGAAAATLQPIGRQVVSVEFKLSLVRPAFGALLRCRAQVLRSGRRLAFVEADVVAVGETGAGPVLVSRMLATMAFVAESEPREGDGV